MFNWFWLLFLALTASFSVMMLNFWQMTHAHKYANIYVFWLGFAAAVLPLMYAVNYIFFYLYWYGYTVVFPGKAWRVQETVWFANILVMFFTSWLYLGELPDKNALAALVFLAGALIAILWK